MEKPYFTYLILAINLLSFFIKFLALIKLFQLFVFSHGLKKLLKNVERSFISYLIVILIDCILCCIYYAAILISWRPGQGYNNYLLFYAGTLGTSWIKIPVVAAFFLTIYRILILIERFMLNYFLHKAVFSFAIITCLALFFYDVINYILGFPKEPFTNCMLFCCAVGPERCMFFIYSKMIFGVGNIILGIFMFGLLFRIQNKSQLQTTTTQKAQAKKRLNTLTLVTLTSDFFCNFSPHIIDILFRYGGINISEHIGPYSSILGAIHSILMAQLYYSRLKLNGQPTSNISETPQNKIRQAPVIQILP